VPFADRLVGLFLEMPGQLLEDVLEHGMERVVQAVAEDAVLLRLALRGLTSSSSSSSIRASRSIDHSPIAIR
jgi:hypothetical protein